MAPQLNSYSQFSDSYFFFYLICHPSSLQLHGRLSNESIVPFSCYMHARASQTYDMIRQGEYCGGRSLCMVLGPPGTSISLPLPSSTLASRLLQTMLFLRYRTSRSPTIANTLSLSFSRSSRASGMTMTSPKRKRERRAAAISRIPMSS